MKVAKEIRKQATHRRASRDLDGGGDDGKVINYDQALRKSAKFLIELRVEAAAKKKKGGVKTTMGTTKRFEEKKDGCAVGSYSRTYSSFDKTEAKSTSKATMGGAKRKRARTLTYKRTPLLTLCAPLPCTGEMWTDKKATCGVGSYSGTYSSFTGKGVAGWGPPPKAKDSKKDNPRDAQAKRRASSDLTDGKSPRSKHGDRVAPHKSNLTPAAAKAAAPPPAPSPPPANQRRRGSVVDALKDLGGWMGKKLGITTGGEDGEGPSSPRRASTSPKGSPTATRPPATEGQAQAGATA